MKRAGRVVMIDTNMFVLPSKFKIDIFDEIKKLVPSAHFYTTESVIREVKKLRDAQIAFKLIKKQKVKIVDEKGETDDGLIRFAVRKEGIICTNDKELKKRCLNFNIPIIFMRAKKKLEMIGE